MKVLRYLALSLVSLGMAIALTLVNGSGWVDGWMGFGMSAQPNGGRAIALEPPFLVAFDPEAPPYFGEDSRRTVDRIQRTIEATRAAQLATVWGSSVIVGSTAADAESAGAATALCIATPDNCPTDVSLSADAIRGLDSIMLGRVKTHAEMLLVDDELGLADLSREEKEFWESFINGLENPEDAIALAEQVGVSHGDPHIITFDQFRYSFQTVGEYTLVRSVDDVFEVQARQTRVPDRQVSLNTAVAMRLGSDRATLYVQNVPDSTTNTPLRVNGQPTTLNNSLDLQGGGRIEREGRSYRITAPTGERVQVDVVDSRDFPFLNIRVYAVNPPNTNLYSGIFGNFNGQADDDLQTRSGRRIPTRSTYGAVGDVLSNVLPGAIPVREAETAYFEQMYREFGDSWRISQTESLFDYGPGQSTATFTETGFPQTFLTLRSLAPAQLREAEAICNDEGVDPLFLEGCVFDVAATEDRSFAEAAGNLAVNWAVDEVRDRVEDEVRDRIRLPGGVRLPF